MNCDEKFDHDKILLDKLLDLYYNVVKKDRVKC